LFVSFLQEAVVSKDTLLTNGSIYSIAIAEKTIAQEAISAKLLWEPIDDLQVPNWVTVDEAQVPNWQQVKTTN
jgi:hypothetical protein